jgi:thioredoxin-like negative regulator of GroEL
MSYRPIAIALTLASVLGAAVVGAVRYETARRLRTELGEAQAEMQAGLYSLARKRLARLSEERPQEPEVALYLGSCEAARGKPDEAIKLWKSIPADSDWAGPAAAEWAQAALALGQVTEAERVLRSNLLRANPATPKLLHLLMIVLGQQGRFDAAREFIESFWQGTTILPADDVPDRLGLLREYLALEFEPFPSEFYLSEFERLPAPVLEDDQRVLSLARAQLATRAGDFERARTELKSSLKRWPKSATVWKAWLDSAIAAGRLEPALDALGKVPSALLNHSQLMDLRVWLAHQRADKAAERQALEQLIASEPGRTAALSRLAELLQQAGQTEASAALRRRKGELDVARDRYFRLYKDEHFDERLPELARLAELQGRQFEARALWEIVKAKDSSNPDARPALARLGPAIASEPGDRRSLAEVLAGEIALASSPSRSPSAPRELAHGPVPQFEDRARPAGMAGFVLDNGVSPIHQLPETACGGVGLLDFDGDGLIDVYCVQGGHFPPVAGAQLSADKLFRNRGNGSFEDVTARSKIGSFQGGYGHGVAVGDYDNDGHADLFVTRWRSYALYHNRGDGTFDDVTKQAGLGGDRDWPTSAAFADLDNDGDLDLYVCHYGVWGTEEPLVCKDPEGTIIVSCDPRRIESLPDHVFRNDGGRFVDASSDAGIAAADRDGRGLGVVAADLDGDGRIDLFVANDSTANFLFRNLGGLRFEELGHLAGVAANADGGYQAGMGVACGDLDGDGLADLAVTNFYGQSTSFFHNLGQGLFADHTSAIGLAAPSRNVLGFGIAFLDANNDGRLDMMTVNGHVSDMRPILPFAMPAQLYLGSRDGTLTEVTTQAGPPFQEQYVGRGLAVGDLDNDGRLDAVMVSQNGPLVYFHNRTESIRGQSVMFRLQGTRSNRDGVGAVVTVRAGGRKQVQQRLGGGSFQSASDPRLHFGLGEVKRVESVEVRWPSGQVDRYPDIHAGKAYLLREGELAPKPLELIRP